MYIRSGSRALHFVVVVLLHAAIVMLMLRHRDTIAPVADPGAFQVSLLAAPRQIVEPQPIPIEVQFRKDAIVVPTPEVTIKLLAEPALAATPMEPAPPARADAGDVPRMIEPADYLQPPAPRYPTLARQARQQGTVIVLAWIDTAGKPVRVELQRSSGLPLLDRAAISAVREALFRPFVEAGIARTVRVLIPIEFSLSQRVASR
jgi:protein TonB